MGKIQCTSSKTKTVSNPESIFNSKPQNWYEKRLKEEYIRLKELSEGRRKVPAVDVVFGINNYKKQLSRFIKWSKIAYEKLPSNFVEEREKRLKNVKIKPMCVSTQIFKFVRTTSWTTGCILLNQEMQASVSTI